MIKMVEVKSIIRSGYSSNVFLVKSEKNFIVDAGMNRPEELIDSIKEFIPDIDVVILTHRHIDHVGNAKRLSEEFDIPLYAEKKEAQAMENGDESTLARQFSKDIFPLEVNTIDFDTYSGFEILHTPGHTNGCICLYHPEEKILFSGDTIFSNGGIGRSDLPTGNINELKDSIKNLTKYDIEKIYPGHMTIVERNGNKHVKRSYNNISYL